GSDGGGVTAGLIDDVRVEVTAEVATVLRVTWTTTQPTTGYVDFGETTALEHRTGRTPEGFDHEVLLLGMPADTEVYFRVTAEGDGVEEATDILVDSTGSLPSGLPTLEVSGVADHWNYQVVPLQGTTYVVTIIDNQGRIVWYDELEPEGNLMRAFISHDRQSMIYCLAGPQSDLSTGRIRWVGLDGSLQQEVALPYVDHDIVELPDGTIGAIVVTEAPEGSGRADQTADRIMELAPDGTLREVWNAWDTLDFDALGVNDRNLTHGNALDYDPSTDSYYLSMKTLGSIARIDRATGQIRWMINGVGNQFSFPPGTEMIELQHQFEVLDGGLLIFDNGTPERGYSRVVELAIDEDARTAEQVWEYIRDPSVYVFAKGDVARFADGSTQVVWSASGEIQDVTPEGEVTWQLDTSLGQAMTFVQIADDLYARD
ncbi:MAG: hypothetical protein D6798_16165, partial [Deltaproteobacteria bacterium]